MISCWTWMLVGMSLSSVINYSMVTEESLGSVLFTLGCTLISAITDLPRGDTEHE